MKMKVCLLGISCLFAGFSAESAPNFGSRQDVGESRWLDIEMSGHGSVSHSDQWVESGSNVVITASFSVTPNTIPYTETFESYTNGFAMVGGAAGWIAPSATNALVSTNSALISSLVAYGEACGYPVSSASHTNVLAVNGPVTNCFDTGANQIVWADYMVMPDHGLLTTDTNIFVGVQTAVGFNLDGHPAVWSYDLAGESNGWTVIEDVTVSTGDWVRLTYTLDYQTDDLVNNVRYFQIRLDGNLLTNAMAWTSNDGVGSAGGTWFAMSSKPDRFSRFSARVKENTSTALDDLVVTTADPFPSYTLMYTAGANGSISGTSPQTVESGNDGTAVTAIPDAGYIFVDWSDSSTVNPRIDSNVTADVSVAANFSVIIPNTIPYTETFESYTSGFSMVGGADGWVAPSSTIAVVSTNSTLISSLAAYSEACGYPVSSTSHTNVMEVNGTVSNLFDMAAGQIVWVDQMVMPSHGSLTTNMNVLAGLQAAVAFNLDDHPAVWNHDLAGGTNRWTMIGDVTVSTGIWVRLTYTLDYQTDDAVNGVCYFQARLNGILLTSPMAWTSNDGSGVAGGSWFAMSSAPDRFSEFFLSSDDEASAALDDLVVTTNNPLARDVTIASAHGQADPAVGTYSYTYGDSISLSLTNDTVVQGINQFVYTNWNMSGHAPASGYSTNVAITLTNDLVLTWLWSTNNDLTALGTPIWWLESHGLVEGDDSLDGDNDGIPTWQEWTSDTVPNDSNSVLRITDIEPAGAGMTVYWKGGVQATQVLEWRTNLASGAEWVSLLTNVPPTSVTSSYNDSAATNREGFYRFKAER